MLYNFDSIYGFGWLLTTITKLDFLISISEIGDFCAVDNNSLFFLKSLIKILFANSALFSPFLKASLKKNQQDNSIIWGSNLEKGEL